LTVCLNSVGRLPRVIFAMMFSLEVKNARTQELPAGDKKPTAISRGGRGNCVAVD
jgi:hypothetical protein